MARGSEDRSMRAKKQTKIKMQSFFRSVHAIILSSILSLFVASFFAPIALADNHGPLAPQDPPRSLPQYNQGVDQSIKEYLCTPTGSGTDLVDCINRLYRFSISAGAIALVFFFVLAGYLYITGGETAKGKAKSIVLSALTGLGILLGSFALLNFINPNLTQIRTIQPPIFSSADLPSCEAIGFSARCIISTGGSAGQVFNPPTGQGGCVNAEQGGCNRNSINACPGMAKDMPLALKICNQESAGGNVAIMSSTDRCREQSTGQVVSFSGGLWQINMQNSADAGLFPECVGVLQHVSPGSFCRISPPYNDVDCTCRFGSGGRAAYDRCVRALADPVRNTKNACILFNQRSSSGTESGIRGWQPWLTSYNKCRR